MDKTQPSMKPNHCGQESHTDTKSEKTFRGIWDGADFQSYKTFQFAFWISSPPKPKGNSIPFELELLHPSLCWINNQLPGSNKLFWLFVSFASPGSLCARNSHQPRCREEIKGKKKIFKNKMKTKM